MSSCEVAPSNASQLNGFNYSSMKGLIESDAASFTTPPSYQNHTQEASPGENFLRRFEPYVYIAIGFIGVVGNGLVVIVFTTSGRLSRRPSIVLVIHQSLVDLGAAFFMLGTSHTQTSVYQGLEGLWGEVYCRVWATKVLLWTMLYESTYNLLAITIERYIAVLYPLQSKTWFSTKRALAVCFVVCILAIVSNSPTLATTAVVDGTCFYMAFWPNAWTPLLVGLEFVFAMYFIPVVMMVFAYGRMALVLRATFRGGGSSDCGVDQKRTHKMQKASVNIVKTFALVALIYVACWTGNVVYFLQFVAGSTELDSMTRTITIYVAFLNCCVNPVIYAFQYEQFQRETKRLFCRGEGTNASSYSSSQCNSASMATRSTHSHQQESNNQKF